MTAGIRAPRTALVLIYLFVNKFQTDQSTICKAVSDEIIYMFEPSFFHEGPQDRKRSEGTWVQEQVEECVEIADYNVGSLQQLRAQQLL